MEEVINAAKAANAHEFIVKFPQKYNQPVGKPGALLSGVAKTMHSYCQCYFKGCADTPFG